jgi:hypothetical protein
VRKHGQGCAVTLVESVRSGRLPRSVRMPVGLADRPEQIAWNGCAGSASTVSRRVRTAIGSGGERLRNFATRPEAWSCGDRDCRHERSGLNVALHWNASAERSSRRRVPDSKTTCRKGWVLAVASDDVWAVGYSADEGVSSRSVGARWNRSSSTRFSSPTGDRVLAPGAAVHA